MEASQEEGVLIQQEAETGGTDEVERGDDWIWIQRHTFTNWVNFQLGKLPREDGGRGGSAEGVVSETPGGDKQEEAHSAPVSQLDEAFRDGVILGQLAQVLTGAKPPGTYDSPYPLTVDQRLDNVKQALKAFEEDGVTLLNIRKLSFYY